MKLSDLTAYNPITIQCHDNPDADAIASGYALYVFFQSIGKEVRFIYCGRNRIQKSNMLLMLEHWNIPISYIEDTRSFLEKEPGGQVQGLLITTDCQYGAGNVTCLHHGIIITLLISHIGNLVQKTYHIVLFYNHSALFAS